MKLAYVVEAYETFVVDEILALRRLGAEVTVLNAFRPFPESDPQKELVRRESLYFPWRYRGLTRANLRSAALAPFAYGRSIVRLNRDGENFRMLALAAHFATAVRRKGISHVHATFGTRTATLASIVARQAEVPFSFTTHAYDIFRPNSSLNWKVGEAAFVRTISEFNKRYITSHYSVPNPDVIKVRYLGVDLAEFPFRAERAASDPLRVLSVGRLTYTKGHADLIAACAQLRASGVPVRCQIVGGGEDGEALAMEIVSRGLEDTVELTGPLARDNVQGLLGMADVLTLACKVAQHGNDQDGIPVALMEAMALGVPVVSTFTSGVPELIDNGVSGLLVPPGDVAGLAAALRMLATNADLRQRLRTAARQKVEARFDIHANAVRLLQLFEGN